MPVKVTTEYSKSFVTHRSIDDTFAFLSDFEMAIPKTFPGVESLESSGPNQYRWIFEKIAYQSYEFQIKLVTVFQLQAPHKITIESIKEAGSSQIEGEWRLESKGNETEVTFDIQFHIELPIPFFLKTVAVPLTQKELRNFFDRYIARATKALA